MSDNVGTGLAAHPAKSTISFDQHHNPDASLVLIGFPGAGKKTLGIMASMGLRRRFVDFTAHFKDEFHICPQAYITQYGSARYLEAELCLYRDLLANYSRGCVIVGPGWIISSELQTLFKEFALRHPIIYIQRDEKALRQCMVTSPETFDRVLQTGHRVFKSCSNFDYYNLSEDPIPGAENSQPSYLKLKETEKSFVGFLNHIFGCQDRLRYSAELFSASPSYALQVPLAWLEEPSQNYHALENGADAVSLVVDATEIADHHLADKLAKSVALIRRHSRAPLIVDVQTPEKTQISGYLIVLALVVRLTPDVLTCSLIYHDEDFRRLLGNINRTKVIATFHQQTPLEWSEEDHRRFISMCNRAHRLGCAAIRITGESRSLEDNLGCVSFLQNISRISPLCVMAHHVGCAGRPSVCLNPVLAPVVLESMRHKGVTLQEAQLSLSSCFLYKRKRFHIIGRELSYSLSPEMHNMAYSACGFPHVYCLTETRSLSDINPLLNADDCGGVAVSLPYKSEVLKYLDEVSEDASNINAVNTVVIEMHNRPGEHPRRLRKGYNTDYVGIRNCVYQHLSPANGIRDGTAALIIGAGGMARAAVYACYQLGVRNICIFNRTPRNAETLIDYFTQWSACRPEPPLTFTLLQSTDTCWPPQLRLPTIVISCIPYVESDNKSTPFQVPEKWLSSKTGGVYMEVAYGPLKTASLREMEQYKSRGWIVVDGFTVLLEQGIAQYELFTRRPAPVHVMRETIQQFKARS
ncbi:hypothetical protein Asppvi_009018 [Aspergillus pseudoviridinutans]|uniref:Quinate repressor protein n=1 Tax=Aspergillus pseudoviridinutans TaxID=1517512 RepID=A0A9P3EVU1_9EURO|nr:uncharacterized protein Asppvi_009018 [Aspergillus pseudoviridinutans]GIJ90069.1 hypothetical protein Asppvi_009018 [Aspergillus pseudoviridinutans]